MKTNKQGTLKTLDLSNDIKVVKTTCAYCGVGCGLNINISKKNQTIKVTGDSDHPANYGRLCSKGSALAETLSLEGRLLYPEVNGERVSWPSAISSVADGFKKIIAEHGPDSVAFYASGQLLTEDYYVANKLMKGFIGSGNIDTNSRLCMSSSVAGHKRAFGSDTVPNCYDDLDHAELIVLIGANSAWCHPVLFQQIQYAKEKNSKLKIVVIDPRKTNTCDIADLHLQINSGSDTAVFNGLLAYLNQNKKLDKDYIESFTEGFEQAILSAEKDAGSIQQVAEACNIPAEDIETFYQWFADTDKSMSLYSQGINQSSSGTDKVNAIINCHLATGRIGKPGSGPLSLTGQPNAMGGREVGGLANQLAAHMGFEEIDLEIVSEFWKTNTLTSTQGLPAVQLFDAIADGKVKAVWVMATNPVSSLPNADKVKRALEQCELVVVSDCVEKTDTLDLAHIKLPAAGWSEKDGTVTNSERRISRQRAFNPLAGDAKPDWWIISEVAKEMGYEEAFNYQSSADIFREHAALSAFKNDDTNKLRDFNLKGLMNISDTHYDELEPIQWPVLEQGDVGTSRLFSKGKFFTENRKARFIAISTRPAVHTPSEFYPFILNTGRVRDQWHSMTRTGLSPRLNLHKPEPFVEIHPEDLSKLQLKQGELAVLNSQWGTMLARVEESKDVKPGMVFAPMHWTSQLSSQGRVGAVVNPEIDPISSQPESKHTPIRISGFESTWQGFILSTKKLNLDSINYRVDVRGEQYWRYEIADQSMSVDELKMVVQAQIEQDIEDKDSLSWQHYEDPANQLLRLACFKDAKLELVLMVQNNHSTLPERAWLSSLFSEAGNMADIRITLLSGKPPVGTANVGKQICACFNVGENTIRDFICEQKLTTVSKVGEACKAGTNCGACVPEIKAIIKDLLLENVKSQKANN
jgi:assimilatory nitrate reductase catalytic subunit